MTASPSTPTVAAADDVRAALRRMVNSVCVLTCVVDGERFAMAATAVNALTMQPPSMIAAINRETSFHRPLTQVRHFGINVLGAQHEPIGRACGGAARGQARFDLGDWESEADTGVPILADAQTALVCARGHIVECGSHSLVVGPVVSVRQTGTLAPLVYLDGRYAVIAV